MILPEALQLPVFRTLSTCADRLGLRAYVIGGFVRDFLLDRPCKDIDVVVEGRGIDLAEEFAKAVNAREVIVYENFGTAMVRHDDFVVEFVGARKESYSRNSRKPFVEEGSLQDDQLRRDFTVNALSLSLQPGEFGKLYDPFGGINDLNQGILRTPQNADITFSDDPLRMMRAIRFATQLPGFSIDPDTYEAIRRNKERINILSMERVADELNKIILAPVPSIGFNLLFESGLLPYILPELQAMHGVDEVDGRAHKDNFYHTLKVLDNVAEVSNDLWLRWVAILHDIAKPLTKRYSPEAGWTFHGHEERGAKLVPKIFRRLKLPLHEQMKYVQKLVRLHQRPIALVSEEVSDSAIRRIVVESDGSLDDLLLFCRCDITSKNERKVARFLRNYDELQDRIRAVAERDDLRNFQPPVTGEMIMEAFGLSPGRAIGQIKNEIREAILDGIIPNELEAAKVFMMEVGPKYLGAPDHKNSKKES
ncbi:MAG: CCA tRNA nucleotidyltransferase [Bacteroidia bacterium]|nr:CCA tRNA nucleotidyltransferase [Bacteroidia bacterium]